MLERLSINLEELKRTKPFIYKKVSILYYNDYVLPFLSDFNVVWGICNKTDIKKLSTLQQQVAYTIVSAASQNKTPSDLFKFLKLQPIDKLIQAKRLTMVYESLKRLAPKCLIDMFQYTEQIHEHELRSTHKLHLKVAHSEFGKKSPLVSGSKRME
ncbi:hypothetical protein HOLleu_38768 [Holothuria leucospilota]|uniref:Uncharacterized protein n=1 Tax=Holothuria leucospilota TaxID=206669 RepID=A0A9Q1BCH4_HOLLE|nr:hypothetical protein HOLleu_38768 [Holothuria leucospilota]